jgi:hypothetical protein
MAYDSADSTVHREVVTQTLAGNAAVSGKFVSFANLLLKRMQAVVLVAGTSSGSGNKVDVYVGTSSVGTVALGSSTAGFVSSVVDLSSAAVVPAGTPVSLKNGTDATGQAAVTLEFVEQR